MTNKEIFCRAVARFQNYFSKMETRNNIIEKLIGNDTTIMDFAGTTEILDCIFDIAHLMFPNIDEDVINDYISWYIYEAVDMDEPYIEDEHKKWTIKSAEDLFDYFNEEDMRNFKEG